MGVTAGRASDPNARRTDSLRSFYRFHAHIYDQTRWAFLFGRRAAVESLGLHAGDHVLEIGCGTGLNFPLLASSVGGAGQVVGVDASWHMLRRARRRIRLRGWPNVRVICAEAATLDLTQRFDAILFGYSLSMIPQWEQSLDRAVALLKPQGRLTVLDFGMFKGWPRPLGSLIRFWLRLNHVDTRRPIEKAMRDLLDNVKLYSKTGGYFYVVAGRRKD
jgi:ubiquinone/menaquinone biosynthesis C-methylase UbiE